MAKFAILLPHAPDRYTALSEDENISVISDYVAWVEDLTRKGIYEGGYKLVDEPGRTLVAGKDGPTVHDGPFAELAEVLGGIMVIEADDMNAAIEIAKTNPHMVHNKRLEIRAVHDV